MSESGHHSQGENLANMSNEELTALGARMDGVETVLKEERWPVAGTRAEKRSERLVAAWMHSGGLSGLALLLIFLL